MIEKKFVFKKSLGQNFLVDNNIKDKIVNAIDESADLVIEIGPGAGALTQRIIKLQKKTICFEVDKRLSEELNKYNSESVQIIFEDFLKVNLNNYIRNYKKICYIGNLPYYITTAIINKIYNEGNPSEIIIMIQKEVGERFMAKPCTKAYGSISVFLQYNFNIEKVCNVGKNCFVPQPKVDSVVIKLTKKNEAKVKNEDKFYAFVKDSFKQKRKNLKNNLIHYDLSIIEKELKKINKDLTYRAEELTLDDFINISNSIF